MGSLCPNILSLVDLVLTIPAASSDSERGFNHLKLAKTTFRSKLTDSHLSDQLTIILESADVSTYDPNTAIALWNSTPRRTCTPKVIVKPATESQPSSVQPAPVNVTDHVQPEPASVPDEDYFSDKDYQSEEELEFEIKENYETRLKLASKEYLEYSAILH